MTIIGMAAAGAWLWGKFGDKVVERAGKLAGATAGKAWSTINWQAAAERYRQEMQRLYGTMRIIGMHEPVALADIFTDVYLLDKPSAWRRYNIAELQQRAQLEPETVHRREERRNGLDLVRSHERLMILGKPGAGKTTLLKHLVLQCTTGNLDAVPIFVCLKDWADSGLALLPFLAQQFAICAFPDAQPFIEHILQEGQALVFFDGLDEVNLEQGARERITREVRNVADQYPRSQCVMTCRTAASEYQFERFSYCELADFTIEQMQTFVTQWFQRDPMKRDAFLVEFAKTEHNRLRDLARTPLLLTLLCLTFEENMAFPERRAEIYEEALDALLKKWDASRSITRDTVYRTLSLNHKRQMLSRIAFEAFAEGALFLSQEQLAQRIVAYVQRLPGADTMEIDGEAILQSIEAQHGLLIERAHDVYSFSHLTFQEYFAARYIVAHPSKKMLRSVLEHAHDARWREVLLLTASLLEDENVETFFDSFDVTLQAMVQDDSNLVSLFQWVQRKTTRIGPPAGTETREAYLLMALSEIVIKTGVTSEGASFVLSFATVRRYSRGASGDNTYDPDVGRELDRDYKLALSSARELAGIDIARKSPNEIAIACFSAQHLANACIRKLAPSMQTTMYTETEWLAMYLLVHEYILSDGRSYNPYEEIAHIWHQQNANATPALHATQLSLALPNSNAPLAQWAQFATDLQTALVTQQDIGHTWNFGIQQLKHLTDYLDASKIMLECLDLAAVADRDAIRNRVLLPPPSAHDA